MLIAGSEKAFLILDLTSRIRATMTLSPLLTQLEILGACYARDRSLLVPGTS